MKDIMNTWTPIKVEEKENIEVSVWGRTYTSGKASFLQSVISQEKEILASPVRIIGTENGKDFQLDNFNCFVMDDYDDVSASICTSAQSESFVFNVNVITEFDGCMDITLSVMPQGRSVNQWFNLGENAVIEYELTRLWLEIPLSDEVAKFYHVYPNGELRINGKTIAENSINQAGFLPDLLEMPFKEQIYISNDDIGFGIFAESDENMSPDGNAIQIIKKEKETVLRLRILDKEPEKWIDKGMENGKELLPLTYRLGMMATPVKHIPETLYAERNVHIDCFKKIPQDYEEFLFSNYENTDEIVMDRLERLGVNTLYIHEKWNDIQNSPFLTTKTAKRLKLIVEEAHKRNIKVIPYFGYEISTLSPYWGKFGQEIMNRESDKNYAIHWYRYPYQRDPIVCYNSLWADYMADGIEQLMDKFGFDGIYIDGMIRPVGCMNEKHGCGYTDKDGTRHKTYPVWAIRKLMKNLYKIVEERGGIINCHSSSAYNLPAISFCHSMWEGEMIQQKLMHGEIQTLPEGHFRSIFVGKNLGLPVYMLCYSNPPVWTFEKALAQSLIFGILPKVNDVGTPLEIISDIWNIFDKFQVTKAKWVPYYENNELTVSNDKLKVSYFEKENKALVICVNTEVCKNSGKIIANKKFRVNEIFNGSKVDVKEDCIEVNFEDFDYTILEIEMEK